MRSFSKGVHVACKYLLAVSLLAVVAILTFNVVLRYVFMSGLVWAEEISRFAVAWITFIGAACCITEGSDITIDSIVSLLSKKGKHVLAVIVTILSLVFICMFIYSSGLMTLRAYQNGQLAVSLPIPLWIAYLSMPVGGIVTVLRLVEKLIGLLKGQNENLREDEEV